MFDPNEQIESSAHVDVMLEAEEDMYLAERAAIEKQRGLEMAVWGA